MGVGINHRTDAAVGPDVDGGLDHIDDGVDGEDESHQRYGGSDTGHEREGEEIATHRDTGIAYCRDDGDERPD